MRILIEKLPELYRKLEAVSYHVNSMPSIDDFIGSVDQRADAEELIRLRDALVVAVNEGEKQARIQLALSSLSGL